MWLLPLGAFVCIPGVPWVCPGSETSLEELMCRVVGDLVRDGKVVKLTNNLFCCGDNPEEVLHNWSLVLQAFHRNNMCLSPSKTVVCVKEVTVLGWLWQVGTLRASPHHISALASVSPTKTVQGLRSFIGAFKVLSRV